MSREDHNAGTPRPIYLAGPVDNADDPSGWREEIKAENPHLTFIDPVERWPDYADDESVTIRWCLDQAEQYDILAGMMGHTPTTGTHHEMDRALSFGNRVVAHIYDPEPLSTFVLKHPEIERVTDLRRGLRLLVERGEVMGRVE